MQLLVPPEDALSLRRARRRICDHRLVTMLLRNIASAGSYNGFCNHQAQSYS